MPYDHSRKIGNQGDVAKHPVLAACLDWLLARSPKDEPFTYAETHAGRADYLLPQDGEWNQGIGAFAVSAEVKADRQARRQGKSSMLGHVGAFDERFVGQEMKVGMRYPGSGGIAFQLLRASGRDFGMNLWDIEQSVADDLTRFFHPWPQVVVACGNGYLGVTDRADLNLVLIDPPSLDTANAVTLMRRLREVNTPFITWVPRTNRTGAEGSTATESETSLAFSAQAQQAGASVFGVEWYSTRPRIFGCWLAVDSSLADVAGDVLKQVVKVMQKEWRVARA